MKALQISGVTLPQQAPQLPMQASTIPGIAAGQTTSDINSLIQPLITIMIVMMMMKMMGGMVTGTTSTGGKGGLF